MAKFLLVYRSQPMDMSGPMPSPEEMQASLAAWGTWIGEFAATGNMIDGGDGLKEDGRQVRAGGMVSDGAYVESKEIVGGYSIVQAEGYDQAAAIAAECPILHHGGWVEVRELAGYVRRRPVGRPRARALVEHFFRHEAGRLTAILSRRFGLRHLDLVEDVVQAALLRALQSWSRAGVPDDPAAWLHATARNLALDAFRRDRRWGEIRDELRPRDFDEAVLPETPRFAEEVADDQLRMLFACCHPDLPPESQVAVALRVLCGFSTPEIAKALLTSEANAQKRVARGKDKLRGVDLAVPPSHLRERVESVRAVVYLLFAEGHASDDPDRPFRQDLCEEAVRLGLLLAEHPAGDEPATRRWWH